MVFEKLTSMIAENMDIDESEITPNTNFVDDIGMDEMDLLELQLSLEDEFDISISSEDMGKIITVADAVTYIQNHI